jgi:hypothetical protein
LVTRRTPNERFLAYGFSPFLSFLAQWAALFVLLRIFTGKRKLAFPGPYLCRTNVLARHLSG